MNVQKQPLEMFYNKAVLKNFAMFIGKNLSWSLLLIKLFQHRSFPVCERLLLNVVFNCNEKQYLLVEIDEMV